jgi:hypothetical protein
MHDYWFSSHRNGDRTRRGIDGRGKSIHATLLPILQFQLVAGFKVSVLNSDNFSGEKGMAIIGKLTGNAYAISDLKILQSDGSGVA